MGHSQYIIKQYMSILHKNERKKCEGHRATLQSNNHYCKMALRPKLNKRAQRALGCSPEDKVKGHSGSHNREPQGHNLNNFGRGPFDDVIY